MNPRYLNFFFTGSVSHCRSRLDLSKALSQLADWSGSKQRSKLNWMAVFHLILPWFSIGMTGWKNHVRRSNSSSTARTRFSSLHFIWFLFKYGIDCRSSHGLVLQLLPTFLSCLFQRLPFWTAKSPASQVRLVYYIFRRWPSISDLQRFFSPDFCFLLFVALAWFFPSLSYCLNYLKSWNSVVIW